MHFTKPKIAALTLPAGKTELIRFDDALPGFGIRIREGGRRVWVAQYRAGAKQRRVTIGRADVIDLEEARKAAKAILAKAQLGQDPQAERAKAKAQERVTFKSVVATYLATHVEKTFKPDSARAARRYLNEAWAPLHSIPLERVDRRAIAGQLPVIAEKSGTVSANRARTTLSSFFSWAMANGLVDANPVIGTLRGEEKTRERVLKPDELRAIWHGCGQDPYSQIVKLLALTGQRRLEIGEAAWSEIDVKAAKMTLPAERAKNGRAHEIPLSEPVLAILAGVDRRGDEDRLFVTQAWSREKKLLDERIAKAGGKVEAWTLHDLRRTLATGLADMGTLPHIVESILNHQRGTKSGVAGTYNRSTYAAEKRQALDLWAAHVMALVNGHDAKVVPLRAGERA